MTYSLVAPDGTEFPLKKQGDGQTDISDNTYTVDATGIPKSGTWRMKLDALGGFNTGNEVGTMDWDMTY
ncbi:hypothetical protein D3C87_2065750 [compost metagenome]